jgi:hypothetical protein
MRKILLTSLALAVAAAPAVAHRGGDAAPPAGPKGERPAVESPTVHPGKDHKGKKGHKRTNHLLHACVVSPATADAVQLQVLWGNRHMRRALDGATALTAKLDADTVVKLTGRARHASAEKGPRGERRPWAGSYADLTTGDRVIVRFRAERGLTADQLPAARKVIDLGQSKRCAPATPPTGEYPKDDTPEGGNPDL